MGRPITKVFVVGPKQKGIVRKGPKRKGIWSSPDPKTKRNGPDPIRKMRFEPQKKKRRCGP